MSYKWFWQIKINPPAYFTKKIALKILISISTNTKFYRNEQEEGKLLFLRDQGSISKYFFLK